AIVTALVLVVLSSSSMIVTVNAQPQKLHLQHVPFVVPTNLPHKLIAPPAPAKIGCYTWTNETGWVSAACESEAWIKSHPLMPLTEGGSTGVYGTYNPGSTALNFGETNIDLTSFSSESDSVQGTNAWSIQTNTNDFLGSNNDDDAVQFGYQNDPNNSMYTRICVWNNDLTTQTYTPTCKTVSLQTLSNGYSAYVEGTVNTGDTLTATFCKGSSCTAVTASDSYGLDTSWDQTAGQILGFSSSTAQFTSSSDTADVSVSPSTSGYTSNQVLTSEQNNWSYSSESTSCGGSTCTDDTSSS
ncbi:MAG: hypothetical protein WCC52_01025, partial [Nitrosotalea sp.]